MSNSLISSNLLLKSALSLAENGFFVLPVKTAKTPYIKNWQNDASNNPKLINEWWNQWPEAGVAIHTGKSKLIVVDVDPRNGGEESFKSLIKAHGADWLSKYKVKTGGGGTHYYYQVAGNVEYPKLLGKGIDLQSGNQYVIAPPSLHKSGGHYEWV